MQLVLNEKDSAFKVMQQEFATIKDFRRKRHELLQELEDQKQELVDTEKRHKEILGRLEKKFFEEKLKLQKEANMRIGELAAKAHKVSLIKIGSGCQPERNYKTGLQREHSDDRGIKEPCTRRRRALKA